MANKVVYDASIDLKEMKKDLKKIEQSFTKSQKDIMQKGNQAGSVFKGMLAADAVKAALSEAVALVKEGIGKIVEETGALEAATVKWEVMLGSAEEAGDKIKEIFEFSNRTPFTFKGVEKAANTLYSLTDGALSSMESIQNLGDRAAKAGIGIDELSVQYGRLYSNMSSGRAMGEQLARMQELGILSGTIRGELEKMSKSDMLSGKGWEKFLEGTSQADGMMEKLSGTINGKLSTLEGVWDGIFAFDDKNVQDSIKDSLDIMIKTLNDNKPTIQAILVDTFGVITKVVNGAVISMLELYNKINPEIENKKDYDFRKTAEVFQIESNYKDEKEFAQFKKAQEDFYNINATGGFDKIEQFQKRNATDGDSIKMSTGEAAAEKILLALMGATAEDMNIDSTELSEALTLYKTNLENFDDRTKVYLQQMLNNVITLDAIEDVDSKLLKAKKEEEKLLNEANAKRRAEINKELAAIKDRFNNGSSMVDNAMFLHGRTDYGLRNEDILNFKDKDAIMPSFEKYFSDYDSSAVDQKNDDKEYIEKQIMDTKDAQHDAYRNQLSIVEDANSQIINIHKILSDELVSGQLKGMQSLVTTTSATLQSIGSLNTEGSEISKMFGAGSNLINGLGFLGAGIGIFSTLASIFEKDESLDQSATELYKENYTSNRAQIVSSGPENIYITNNFEINAGYIGDTVGTNEFFEQEISPRISSATVGVIG